MAKLVITVSHHAAVEEAEAGDGHHQDERHRGEHPGGVAGVWGAIYLHLGVAGGSGFRGCSRGGRLGGRRRLGMNAGREELRADEDGED
jgi:hypothetical protein